MLATLDVTSSAQAGNGYPNASGVGSPRDPYSPNWDPFYPYFFRPSPSYYRGRDGHLYPAGPPAFPDGYVGPPAKLLPGRRPSRFYSPSPNPSPSVAPASPAVPANAPPPIILPGEP
jgi:hypothetical protein